MRHEERTALLDLRGAVGAALAELDTRRSYQLLSSYARAAQGPCQVIWGEWDNHGTDSPVVDEVTFQVQLRCQEPDGLRELAQAVNAALTGLGLRRVYAGPDGYDGDTLGVYTKTYRFGRKVDKRWMRFVD